MITYQEWQEMQKTAIRRVHAAVRKGDIAKPQTLSCTDCGAKAHGYDHRDYTETLKVEPVCSGCNYRRGNALPEYDPATKPEKKNLHGVAWYKNREGRDNKETRTEMFSFRIKPSIFDLMRELCRKKSISQADLVEQLVKANAQANGIQVNG